MSLYDYLPSYSNYNNNMTYQQPSSHHINHSNQIKPATNHDHAYAQDIHTHTHTHTHTHASLFKEKMKEQT